MNCLIEWTYGDSAVKIEVNGTPIAEINAVYKVDSNDILTAMKGIVVDAGLTIGSCFNEAGLYQSLEVDDATKNNYKDDIENCIKSLKEQFNLFAGKETDGDLNVNSGLARDKTGGEIYTKVYQVCIYILSILTRVYICTLIPSQCKNTGEKKQQDAATEANIIKIKQMLKDTTTLLLNIDNLKTDDKAIANVPNGGANGGANGAVAIVPTDKDTAFTYDLSVNGQNLVIKFTGTSLDATPQDLFIDLVELSKNITAKETTTKHFSIPLLATKDTTWYLNQGNFHQDDELVENIKQSLKNLINATKENTFEEEFDSYIESQPVDREKFIGLKFARHAIYVTATKLFIVAAVMLASHKKTCSKLSDRNQQYEELKKLYRDTTSILLNMDTFVNGDMISTNIPTNVWPGLGKP